MRPELRVRDVPKASARIGRAIEDGRAEGAVLNVARPSLPKTMARALPRFPDDAGEPVAAAPSFS